MAVQPLQREMRARRDGAVERGRPRVDGEVETLKEQARSTHEEARMVLPGIQALFGFQLIAVFNPPFFDLAITDRWLHLAALILIAIAVGLIMAPAAHHRLVHPNIVSSAWIRHAARDIAWAMAALQLAIGLDVYLVTMMIAGARGPAVVLGAGASALLCWLWFIRPFL